MNEYNNFKENLKMNDLKKKILDVYICDQIRYISKEDYVKYMKEEPKAVEKTSDLEIVPIEQEKIDRICLIYALRAQLQMLRTRERETENNHQKEDRPKEVKTLKYVNDPEHSVEIGIELEL